jgi:hypothetical protein
MAEALHAPALEGVDADPLQLELALRAEHRADARDHLLRLLLFLGVGVPAELEVDAPDVVGLAVQQHALPRVERRVEPEPALGGEVGLHHHVGDQEAVLEHLAFDVEAEHATDRAACAVGDDQPVGVEGIRPVGRLDLQPRALVLRRHAGDLVLPAQLQVRQLLRALHQELFEVVLLQVHHARPVVVGLGQQVEAEHLVAAEEGAADVPGHALVDHRIAAAEPVEDLQRALGIAQPARADADGVVVVEQQHALALHRQVDGRGQAHRAGTDHDHRMAVDRAGKVELGRPAVGELRIGVGAQHRRAFVSCQALNSFSCIQAACLGARRVFAHSSSIAHFTSSSFAFISGVAVSAASSTRCPFGSKK